MQELRVVFETWRCNALIECPICSRKGGDNRNCWFCDGDRWIYASSWDFAGTVLENIDGMTEDEDQLARLKDYTITAPEWLDVMTGKRKPGAVPPHADCVCHEDAAPCPHCGRLMPHQHPLCALCMEAGVNPPTPFASIFAATPEVTALQATIASLEAEREADKARLAEALSENTRSYIKITALTHTLSQVLKTHAAFLAALRDAERLLKPDEGV